MTGAVRQRGRLSPRNGSSYPPDAATIAIVSPDLTRRRAVDLLRVATALCLAS
jgi:hypothetical protein